MLGRGDAPVVWWALEGAPLLEHVEVVKLRGKPYLTLRLCVSILYDGYLDV